MTAIFGLGHDARNCATAKISRQFLSSFPNFFFVSRSKRLVKVSLSYSCIYKR